MTGRILALFLLALGVARFLKGAWLPASRALTGDFGGTFPTATFAALRPDFSNPAVLPGWNYGPMLHFLTAPLLLVPRWSWVPAVWASVNLIALTAGFVLVCRLSGVARQLRWPGLASLAGAWLLFQPLVTCFAQGNIEIVEMAMVLGALTVLQRSERLCGVLIGLASMTKFLPVGFLGWLLLRGRWRAVLAGIATIAAVAVLTTFTLGWKESISFWAMGWAVGAPVAGLHELSVTSLFVHAAGVLDAVDSRVRWFPSARAVMAGRAGAIASLLLAGGIAAIMIRGRRRPVSPVEISVLFMTMFMILPWNHDYYYVFALVPFSVLFLKASAERDWNLLAIVITAYLMISPPVPFSWIDARGWLPMPFAYAINYIGVPILGGLLLWFAATYKLLAELNDEPVAQERRFFTGRRIFAAVGLGGVVLAAALVWLNRAMAGDVSPGTFGVAPPVQRAGGPAFAVSRDGRRLAYIAETGALCSQGLDQQAASCWSEIRGARAPFFSPSGRWIGFFAEGAIKRVPAGGGAIQEIVRGVEGYTADWDYDRSLPTFGREGRIVFAAAGGIYAVAGSGGETELVIPLRPGDDPYLWPTMMPSGETVLFTIAPPDGSFGAGTIVAHSLKTGRRKRLLAGSQPHFDRAARALVYTLGGRVLAVPLDPETLTLTGASVPLTGSVLVTVDGGAHFAISDDALLLYSRASQVSPVRRRLFWVDRQGRAIPLPIVPDAFEAPRLSPDGRAVATLIRDVLTDVWMYDVATGKPLRLSAASPPGASPVWQPDGSAVSFVINGPIVVSSRVDAPGREPTRLWEAGPGDARQSLRLGGWARNGSLLAGTQQGDLWLLDAEPSRPPRAVLIRTPFTERAPAVSHDGRWVAYTSDASGSDEIYAQAYPGLGDPQRVTHEGGAGEPLWSADGRELFYRRGQSMMAIAVAPGSTFKPGAPRRLFEGSFAPGPLGTRNYDVSSDGQRFLMVGEAEPQSGDAVLSVLRNWPAAVRR